MAEFTHFNESGRARMVDVSAKDSTERVATAQAIVFLQPETLEKIRRGKIAKGDVLSVAQVAGVMGAKRTPDLIPMCHPILLTSVDISFKEEPQPDREGRCSINIVAIAKTTGPTGVEMEAMTAASVAALTIYDMCKAIDRGMSFSMSVCSQNPAANRERFRSKTKARLTMVTIKLFGMTKSLVSGQSSLALALANGRQVKDLIELLNADYPMIGELIHKKKVLVSVNQEIAHEDTTIQDGDEVALLPPFAGGGPADQVSDDTLWVRVQREDFSVDAEINRVRARSKRIGGIATFLGVARDRSKGRDVDSITFEHYEGMAQAKLREIRERALKDFDIIEIAILHRYGEISIGENIVLIVVGAEHRAEAFRACEWSIAELKRMTPIWKREHTPEGEVWVEEHP